MMGGLPVGLVLFAGAFFQSCSGFGFGLVALPLLLWVGIPLPGAVIMVVIASATQKILATLYFRFSIRWKQILPLMAVGLLTLPFGVLAMARISLLAAGTVKQIVGVLVLMALAAGRVTPKSSGLSESSRWGFLAAGVSGFLNGFANIGGPPIVLWILRRCWSNEALRGSLLAFSLVFVPIQIPLMVLVFGDPAIAAIWQAAAWAPIVLLGSWLGLRFADRWSVELLKRVMEGGLILIALSSIAVPLLQS